MISNKESATLRSVPVGLSLGKSGDADSLKKKRGSSYTAPTFRYHLRVCVLFAFLPHRFGFLEGDLVILFIHTHLDGGAILEFAAEQFQ